MQRAIATSNVRTLRSGRVVAILRTERGPNTYNTRVLHRNIDVTRETDLGAVGRKQVDLIRSSQARLGDGRLRQIRRCLGLRRTGLHKKLALLWILKPHFNLIVGVG